MKVRRLRGRCDEVRRGSDGFTLIEMVITISIMGVVVVALCGIMIAFAKNTRATAARLDESAAVQFVAAYWQRDVSSIGIRSTTYDQTAHNFPLQNSVNVSLGVGVCASAVSAAGTNLITLAWNEYASTSPTTPNLVTVSYVVNGRNLTRIRCHYVNSSSTWIVDSTNTLSNRISGTPTVSCDGGSCSGLSVAPDVVTLSLTVLDTSNDASGSHPYSVVLTGERRQT